MGVSALTIDRAIGGIVLGKPLDLTVKVLLAPGEEMTGLCAQVDVTYGDTLQEPSRVSVSTESAIGANAISLKVRSANPVDEPVVVLEVRAGCKQTISRRFVLLSDLSSDLYAAVVPEPIVAVLAPAAVLATPINKPAPAVEERSAPASVIRMKPKAVPRPGFVSLINPAAEERPRLRLAPIDLSQDWDPLLKTSPEMEPPAAEDLNKRREAAAYWRFLNLTPKETLRIHAQEDELKALKLMMAKSQLQMQEMNQQLQSAEEQRYANPLVYTLIALMLALSAGAVYVYRRLGGKGLQDAQWWRATAASNAFKPSESPDSTDSLLAESDGVLPLAPDADAAALSTKPTQRARKTVAAVAPEVPVAASPAPQSSAPFEEEELDFILDGEPDPQPLAPSPSDDLKDSDQSLSGAMRSINTHDMLDVRQQAEFFMTLGQCEDAIDMLQNSISHSEDANPLVYLDLLKMLHTLSRKTEYDSVRKDFNRIFTGRVPPYIAFNEPTKGLESYPDLCEKIVTQWPQKSAIGFIEQCMVRGSLNVANGRLDLEAFRDLLMLHALAKQFDAAADAQVEDFSTAKSDLTHMVDFADSQPMMLEMPMSEPEPMADLLLPPTFEAQSAPEVDLDLSDSNDNLIDFDPSIFSLDLPESKP